MFKIFTLILFLLGCGFQGQELNEVNFYTNTMCVVAVDYEQDIVTIADFNGVEFQFYGCDDWSEGNLCSVLMCDNGTDIIYDDAIISTRYSGWVEQWGFDITTGGYLYYYER